MARGDPPIHRDHLVPTYHYDTQTAADCSATKAELAGHTHNVRWIHCGYDADPAAGYIEIKDGVTPVWRLPILVKGPNVFEFPDEGRPITKGNALTVTLGSGAGAVVGFLAVKTT